MFAAFGTFLVFRSVIKQTYRQVLFVWCLEKKILHITKTRSIKFSVSAPVNTQKDFRKFRIHSRKIAVRSSLGHLVM